MSDQDAGATPGQKLCLVPKSPIVAPKHAFDPRQSDEPVTATVPVVRAELFEIVHDLKQLTPCHRNPHRFHERKDELVSRIYNLATAKAPVCQG